MAIYRTVEQAIVGAIFNSVTYDKHVPTLREILLSNELSNRQKARCLRLLGVYVRNKWNPKRVYTWLEFPDSNENGRISIEGGMVPSIIEIMKKESKEWLQKNEECLNEGKELPFTLMWDIQILKFDSEGTPLDSTITEWRSSYNNETTRVL